jgi:ABC-2 type transport system permease protein
MIGTFVRTGFLALRRDRAAFILSFVLPIAFFSIFASVFGGMRNGGTPRVTVLVVDEDHSAMSQRLVRGLLQEAALNAVTRPESKKGQPVPPDYTASGAEAAVKRGDAPAALIVPKGFGEHAVEFGPGPARAAVRILHDSSDPIAAPMISGCFRRSP